MDKPIVKEWMRRAAREIANGIVARDFTSSLIIEEWAEKIARHAPKGRHNQRLQPIAEKHGNG